MRHIDDGYSYEFYEYTQDVLDYYLKKSDYNTYAEEDKYRETRLMVIDDRAEEGYDFDGYYGTDEKYKYNALDEEYDTDGIYEKDEGGCCGGESDIRSCSDGDITFSCGIF